MWPVARPQTDRHTDKGFIIFSFNLSSRIGPTHACAMRFPNQQKRDLWDHRCINLCEVLVLCEKSHIWTRASGYRQMSSSRHPNGQPPHCPPHLPPTLSPTLSSTSPTNTVPHISHPTLSLTAVPPPAPATSTMQWTDVT